MVILLLDWKAFGNEDVYETLCSMGHSVIRVPFTDDSEKAADIKTKLDTYTEGRGADFLFSFNFFPEVSKACNEMGLKYVSWVYDSPHIQVYNYAVINPCNYVCLFDYSVYAELKNGGINTVYYLPLAVNEVRMASLDGCRSEAVPDSDVSFVGSLYSEKKHRIYDKFASLPEHALGYLDGIVKAQMHVQGWNFLKELLTDDIVEEMQKIYPCNPNSDSVMSPKAIYADYVLARQVTGLERLEILSMLGKKLMVNFFTHDMSAHIDGVNNLGPIDYYDHMPYVFRQSKINLNITLRSIRTGIPLRVFDIMGNGGFLITNYQEEMLQYFEPGVDFVFYESFDDLCDKVEYYLEHEEERRQIAENGCRKVREYHNYRVRFEQIISVISE